MMNYIREHIIPKGVGRKESSDTGMAMVLIVLLAGYFTKRPVFYSVGIPLLVLNMVWPMVFYPVALLWLGLTNLLGMVLSKVLLTVVYVLVLLPMGLIRRMAGRDPLLLRGFKKSGDSVMVVRDHAFVAEDMVHPY